MYIQQLVFLFPPPFDRGNLHTLIMAILYEILINIPVAGLQFPYQRTFGHFPMTEQTVWSHLVSQTRDQERILSQMPEQCAHLLQILPQNPVSVTFGQFLRKSLPFADTVSIGHIRVTFRSMPALVFFDAPDCQAPA